MYASGLKTRERGGALAGVIAVHAVLMFALLNLSGTLRPTEEQPDLIIFDQDQAEPPPPPTEVQPREDHAPEEEGAAAPPNIRSQATPVVAPEPEVRLPVPPPITVSPTPNEGSDPTQGAAETPGPGTGAGGVGTGTGAGGRGSGPGGGGGAVIRATVTRGITNRDYPVEIQRRWPRNGTIFVRLRIEPDGRPSQCDVLRGYGDRNADQWTCALLLERGIFRPGRNERGQPVADWVGYAQRDLGRFDR